MASLKIRIRSSRTNKHGESPLFIQVFSGKTKKELSLGIAVKASDWDNSKSIIKRKNPRHGQLNAIIRSRKSELQNIIDELQKHHVNITADEIVRKYKSKPLFETSDTTIIVDFMRDYVKRNPDSRKKSTLLTYVIFINCFSEFKPRLKFSELQLSIVKQYDSYLKAKGLAVNTISNRMKILRRAIGLGIESGILDRNPMVGYKRIRQEGSIEYLTIDEVAKIEDYRASTPNRQKVIDLYLFRVYCGLRVSDQMTLTKDQVKINGDTIHLDLEMNKVRGRVAFKLNDKAKAILLKYYSEESMFVFNILNEKKDLKNPDVLLYEINKRTSYFNNVTKDMASLLEINKTITTHTARHTFATISLEIGIPIHVVSNLLGHKSIKETQVYAKVVDKSKEKAIDLWNNI